jgi:hypothetical protein
MANARASGRGSTPMIFRNGQAAAYSSFRRIREGSLYHEGQSLFSIALSFTVIFIEPERPLAPVYYIRAFGRGTVPHGGLAAVQDDITISR